MLLTVKRTEDNDVSIIELIDFERISKEDVLDLFDKYRDKGTIYNCNFNDSLWFFSNQATSFSIRFGFDELLFTAESKTRALGTFDILLFAIKSFLLYQLDDKNLSSIRGIYYDLKNVFNCTKYFNPSERNNIFKMEKQMSNHILDFIEFYPVLNVDEKYIEIMEILYEKQLYKIKPNKNTREIGNFESVFRLGEKIDVFWENAKLEEKEKYFPIILWWRITTRIPIRATEFILTPYDCLKNENGQYFLTIRRTNQKGDSGKKQVTHSIDGDYRLERISISEDLYNLIEEYKQMVDDYDFIPEFYGNSEDKSDRRQFLISNRSYYKHIGNKGAKGVSVKRSFQHDFFNYGKIRQLLHAFYINIVQNQFNLVVIPKLTDDSELKEYQIELLSPMDTRHHAFINAVLNDVEPLFVKQLGGHSSVSSSLHYFSHVDKFVKCFTYSMARRLNSNAENNLKHLERNSKDILSLKKPIKFKEVKGGKCSSEQSCNLEDCRKVIFQCDDDCGHFHRNNVEEIKDLITKNEREVSLQIEELRNLFKSINKVKNFKESYGQRVNKIKSVANQNALLISKYRINGGD